MILGALVILIYTFIGGFWAVSLTDSIQAVLMFCIAIFLPLLLLMVAGGFSGVNLALEAIGTPEENSYFLQVYQLLPKQDLHQKNLQQP